MASYEYQVLMAMDDVDPAWATVQPSALHNMPCERWTSATASEYARLRRHDVGTLIVVERRRVRKSHSEWMHHRSYLVYEDGIVRRTDR